MFKSPAKKEPVQEQISSSEPVHKGNNEYLLKALNDLIEGEYEVDLAEDDPVCEAVLKLAKKISANRKKNLEQMVNLSMQSSEALAAVSFVTGDVREVADNTNTIASAVEELNATINEISQSSNSVVDAANATEEAVNNGRIAVNSSVESIDSIANSMGRANERLENLSEAVNSIAEILGTIESIAKQTNLLALNATIEAARAGAAGKGFAVVASEVKQLAGQTAKATEDIQEKINAITEGMNEMSDAMVQSVGEVDSGRSNIHKAGEEMDNVVENITNVTRLMSSTASSVTEQSAAINEIARSIDMIKEMTERCSENAELALEASNNSAKLVDERLAEFQQMNIPNAVMDYAKSDHITWKKKLAAMLVGKSKLTADELADHHHCRLGKWYYGITDSKMKECENYRNIEEPHAQVHAHGKKAAELFAKGDRIGAMAEYEAMSKASVEVVKNLEHMKKKCA
jgi:methyl-accepting chemotaxis protein